MTKNYLFNKINVFLHVFTIIICYYCYYYSYVRLLLEADAIGQLPIRKVQKMMMVPKSSKSILDNLESAKTNVKQMVRETACINKEE